MCTRSLGRVGCLCVPGPLLRWDVYVYLVPCYGGMSMCTWSLVRVGLSKINTFQTRISTLSSTFLIRLRCLKFRLWIRNAPFFNDANKSTSKHLHIYTMLKAFDVYTSLVVTHIKFWIVYFVYSISLNFNIIISIFYKSLV